MIILRIFLYLICIISIGWSVLVFGGPPIIKSLISAYSGGALKASGIRVSPTLGISISRLDFVFQNEILESPIEGFSRATEISWSVFGEEPAVELNLGPSVLKSYATADSLKIYTPTFREMNWQNIVFSSHMINLAVSSYAQTESLILSGSLNLKSKKVSNVQVEASSVSAAVNGSRYSASSVGSNYKELEIGAYLPKQLTSSTFAIEDIMISEFNLSAPEAIMKIMLTEEARNFKINLSNVKFSEFGGYAENLKVDGRFNQVNALEELHLAFENSIPIKKSPKFPEISARVKKTGDKQYELQIKGNVEEFELHGSDNYIGLLPDGHFVIDLEIDRAISRVTSRSKINFNASSAAEIIGNLEMGFQSEFFKNSSCSVLDCKLSDLAFDYTISFDEEWVRGRAECPESFCGLSDIVYVVRTSNTINVFTILNQAQIINPLSSLYLLSVISTGQKINGGHELKFQF